MNSARFLLCLQNVRLALEAGLFLVLPLLFSRSFTEQFSYPKKTLAEVLVILATGAWALGALWGKCRGLLRNRLTAPLALLAAAVLLSCANSPVPTFSLLESVYFLCGPVWVLALLGWNNTSGDAEVRGLYTLSALSGTAVALIAVLQWLGHDPLLFGGYRINWGNMVARMRVYATFGNPNFVAGYLIATIFVAAALAAVSAGRGARAAWTVAAAIMLVAIVGTGSRGAWIGLAAGLAVAASILTRESGRVMAGAPKASTDSSLSKVRAVAMLALLGLLSTGLAELVNVGLRHLEGRVFLWRTAWPMFAAHPILGSGWATFQLRFLELQASYLAAHPEMVRHWSNIRQLHNDLFQLLLEAGLLGLLAFAWLLWVYARRVQSSKGLPRSARFWLAASAGGTAAILVDSFFNFEFAIPPTFILLFTLIAVPELLADRDPSSAASLESGGTNASPPRWSSVLRFALSLAVLAAVTLLLVRTARDAVAEGDYALGMQIEHRGELPRAEEAYRHGIERNPLNGRLHFGLARVFYLTGRFPAALTETQLAERTYADSHLEVLKARVQDRMGLATPALETYRHALALDPTLKTVQADIDRLAKSR